MPQEYYIHAKCGRCENEVQVKNGDSAAPVGLTQGRLTTRLKGSGWSNSKQVFDDLLCPACTVSFQAWVAEGKKAGE